MPDSTLLFYVFVIVAGWLATDIWRWLGVIVGKGLQEDSSLFIWVKAVATSLVAAVIAKLILTESGNIAEIPIALRLGAVALGFAAFYLTKKHIGVGVGVALSVLLIGTSEAINF